MKKAIFFDLDGTLWDAIDELVIAYNDAMRNNNLKYRFNADMMRSYMGHTPEEIIAVAFPDVTLKRGLEIFDLLYEELLSHLSKKPGYIYDGVEDTLKELSKKYPLYVLSNGDVGYIEAFFEGTGLGKYFKDHLCAGDTGLDKSENIKFLKDKENLDQVIYVGDTIKDKIETLKAGQIFIHAAYGFGEIEDEQYKVDSFPELIDLIDKIFNELN